MSAVPPSDRPEQPYLLPAYQSSQVSAIPLPAPLTSLVDRLDELAVIVGLLGRADVRLLTLTGAGGVGKTRLAIAAAGEAATNFADGVAFVELGAVADHVLVGATIARALGLRDVGSEPPKARLLKMLAQAELLLVLDNFEQVVAAAPLLSDLLEGCRGLKMLVTSRVRLRLSGEQEVPVGPLSLAAANEPRGGSQVVQGDAVQLFVERAQAVRPEFVRDGENQPVILEIVRRLDGLPLAIELAAVRVKVLPPVTLLRRLESRLPLLTGGGRDLPARQQTMRDTIAWSYDLLAPAEQALFCHLAVFAGGFTIDAAEAISYQLSTINPTAGEGSDSSSTIDGIAALVEQSLLRLGDAERYQMMETVREFAQEQLEARDEADETRSRHLAHYLALAEQAARAMLGPDETPWLNRLDREVDNLRQAQDWAVARGSTEAEWRLVAALALFWVLRGYLREGRRRAEAALARARSRAYDADPVLRARFLEGAGLLDLWSGDDERAAVRFEESLAATEEAGDRVLAVHVLGHLSYVVYAQGDVARARALIAEMLTLARAVDSGLDIGYAFLWRVLIAIGPHGTAQERGQLRGELDEPVARLRETGMDRDLAELLAGRARLLVEVDIPAAFASLREALTLGRGADDPLMFIIVPWLALVMVVKRLPAEQVVRLGGGIATLEARSAAIGGRTHIEVFGTPEDRARLTQAVAASRERLGEAASAAVEAAGRALTFDALLDELLAVLDEAGPGVLEASEAESGPRLTRRERQVLRLLVEGLSDRQIGAELGLSPRTVGVHVSNLLAKLGVETRTAAVTVALRQGIVDVPPTQTT